MSEWIGVGGAWKTKAAEWIGVGGSWKQIASEWIGVSGAWKVAYVAISFPDPITGSVTAFSPNTASTVLAINDDGTYSVTGGASGTWLAAGPVSAYEARLTQTGLTAGSMAGTALSTWVALSTSRSWGLNVSTNTEGVFTGTLEIRSTFDNAVVLTRDVTLTSTREA